MSRKNRDFFREKLEFLRDRHLLLFIDIARRECKKQPQPSKAIR